MNMTDSTDQNLTHTDNKNIRLFEHKHNWYKMSKQKHGYNNRLQIIYLFQGLCTWDIIS